MKEYQDHTGTIIKKHRNFLGRYIITIDGGLEKISVIVGKGIYNTFNIGQGLIIGHCGKKLINIRPFNFSKKAIIWNKFIDEIAPCDIKTDDFFNKIKPSLTDIIEKYVLKNHEKIFE